MCAAADGEGRPSTAAAKHLAAADTARPTGDSEKPSQRLRLFVACPLPSEVERAATAWQQRELAPRRELRLTRQLHLTLVFLGGVDAGRVPELRQALAAIRWSAIDCRLTQPLFLPLRGRKRIIALALDDPCDKLQRLQSSVSRTLVASGLHTAPTRPWLPHLTVARFTRDGQPFPLQNVNFPALGLERMVLYSSDTQHSGAVHTPLADFPAS